MCGIFAVYPTGTLPHRTYRALYRHLAEINDARGGCSHGVWGAQVPQLRGLGDIEGSPALRTALDRWRPYSGNWLAGHTRFATHGSRTIPNAHPFHDPETGWTLAHNGIIDVEGYYHAHEVDSAQLLAATVEEGLPRALKLTTGSAGLLLSVGDMLMIYRANQELFWTSGSWGWAVSSAKRHLEQALRAVGVSAQVTGVPEETLLAPWHQSAPMALPFGGTGYRKWPSELTYWGGSSRSRSSEHFWDPPFPVEASEYLTWEDETEELCEACRKPADLRYCEMVDEDLCEDCIEDVWALYGPQHGGRHDCAM